jgi:Na+-translocating ferredoxin:NAD+ oxidoreductase RnfD subunit
MTTAVSAPPQPVRTLRRFFRTPKGSLLPILVLIAAIAAPAEGIGRVLPNILCAVAAAGIVDLTIIWVMRGTWVFPSGALLTGLIVALVLSPIEPWYVAAATAAIAIGSKYLFRSRWSNVFNPAALALVVSVFLFSSAQSWWGGFPDLSPLALVLLLGAGIYIANHINKLPLVLVFLASYFVLFTATALLGSATTVAEIFRTPDVNAVIFFAFFMLDDPPTCPARYADQLWFGLLVAAVSFAVFLAFGVQYYLLAGLLVGNLWETWRRWTARQRAAMQASS